MLVYYKKEWKKSTNSWRPGVNACLLTKEKFYELTRSEEVSRLIRDHRQGVPNAKIQLPAAVWVGTQQEGGYRKAENMTPTQLYMVDLDHISQFTVHSSQFTVEGEKVQGSKVQGVLEAWEEIQKRMRLITERTGYDFKLMLAHITPSGEGLRMVLRCTEDFPTLAEHMEWLNQQLGLSEFCKWDSAVHDLSRISFLPQFEDILFIDNNIFNAPFEDFKPITNDYDNENKTESSPSRRDKRGAYKPLRSKYADYTYHGHRMVDIIDRYIAVNGEPEVGERHNFYNKMVADFRNICGNSPDVLLDLLPRYDGDDAGAYAGYASQCQSICRKNDNARLPREFYYFLVKNGFYKQADEGVVNHNEDDNDNEDEGSHKVNVNAKKLPIGLKESLVGVPEKMQMPVLCAVMPIAATYADQVEVEYCDGTRQRLGLMSIIRGEQASGKSVCKNAVDVWKRQLDEEDAQARKREEEWKERKKARKANEKAPDDPKVLIRTLPVTVSCSTLLKRLKYSHGHTLYSFGEELDTLRKTNGAGSWSSKYDIYRLSFDRGEWGQDYNSDQAESGVVNVAYNWTMLGTDGAMRKCFRQDNIENGLSSRILVSEMPDTSFAKMPKYGKRSDLDEQRIQEAVTILRSVTGFIDTPRLRKAIEKWVEEKRVEAAKDIDHVKDTYRKRAAVIGFRCGVIYHLLMQESRETAATIKFALMMAQYCLDEQLKAFGNALRREYIDAQSECQRYGANHSVFDQLPPAFTLNDLAALKRSDLSRKSIQRIVSRWRNDGWVKQVDKFHWQKIPVGDKATNRQLDNKEV